MIIDGKQMLKWEFKLNTKELKKTPLKISPKSKSQSWNQIFISKPSGKN